MRALVVYGTVAPHDRLFATCQRATAAFTAADASVEIVDFHAAPVAWADGRRATAQGEATLAAVRMAESAEVVLLGSPVYRAAPPGVLKNLLDLLPVDALRSKPVGTLSMAETPRHALSGEHHLHDVLTWFGALAAPTSVFITGEYFSGGVPTPEVSDRGGALASILCDLASAMPQVAPGPPPDGIRQ